jgi:excisionase family DNA binding protein
MKEVDLMEFWETKDRKFSDILTVKELMDYLAIGKNTAYDLLKSNKIKSIRIGRVYKIPKTEVQEYIRRSFTAK